MAEDVLEEGEVVEEQEGQMAERMGDGWGMAEAEGGLNSRSATCYLAVAISGMYMRGKRWFEQEDEKEANCTRGNPWSYILYEQKETIFE